ncbi:MAG: response regulator [Chloroflexi bacterium]|nr:response regulator [Chloroflexota bacterium]
MNERNKNVQVLIAEDDYLISTMIQEMLEHKGHTVVGKAVDGLQAVEMTCQLFGTPNQPDVILMDIKMPDMDGIEATRMIQKRCPTPVVALTAYEAQDLVAEAGAAGVGAYLVKPPDAREMERAITIAIARFDGMIALRQSEERLETIFDSVQIGIVIIDAETHVIVDANPVAVGMIGDPKEEIVGSICHRYICPSKIGNCPVTDLGQDVNKAECELLKSDGEAGTILKTVAPVMLQGRKHLLESFIDISERKQAEEGQRLALAEALQATHALREAQEKMMEQERLAIVGQMAAGIAHEFNNLLASITLNTQVSLHTPRLDPQTRELMEVVVQESNRAAGLVQQILDFGRQAMLRRETLDLLLLVQETIKLLERSLPENIEINLAFGSAVSGVQDSEPYVLDADPARVQQTIVNLALNAQDAMPKGGELGIELQRLRVEQGTQAPVPEMQAGEWIQLTVRDTGTGIPPDVLPHIYEPFFTTRAPVGHGLGLAQVHGIVKQHGGHITVATEVGRGTTFCLYWPALPESH